MPSNAHGCGYTDLNFIIPELIRKIDYGKGPYYADVGDFGAAGWENIQYVQSLPQDFEKFTYGSNDYVRELMAASTRIGQDNLLGALEIDHMDGPWVVPENYDKINGYAGYSHGDVSQGWSASGVAYHGTWNATDQLPLAWVPYYGDFGNPSPSDGGLTDRYLLSGEYHEADENAATKIMAYAYYYHMALWNDFNYFYPELPDNDSAIYGDQFEQLDSRCTQGLRATRSYFGQFWGFQTETTYGLDFRNDVIHDTLNRTDDRVVFLEVRSDDIIETDLAPYVENKTQWAAVVSHRCGLSRRSCEPECH